MCGIVGAISTRNIVPILTEGLKRLEYRGYDSAGLAVMTAENSEIQRVRRVGRVAEMEDAILAQGLQGVLGIGHTRWATHGGVTESNAHPHFSQHEIAVVHNGIIENHEALRTTLKQRGYVFDSQTDTEVIAHLVHRYFLEVADLFKAVQLAAIEMHGAYAIGVISRSAPDRLVCARVGCPLLIGVGRPQAEGGAGENFIASDVTAVLPVTRRVIYLEEGDVASITRTNIEIVDRTGAPVHRQVHLSDVADDARELGPYTHFMQKETHEQPRAIADTLEAVITNGIELDIFGTDAQVNFSQATGVLILASGTSFYAGMVAKQWIETIARVPCQIELGHEYRYRDSLPDSRQIVVTISQSGETLDTMEALKRAKALGHTATLSICNVRQSAIPRASSMVFYTRAGAEIGVASTKAFTTQLAALYCFALGLAKAKNRLTTVQEQEHIDQLRFVPGSVQHALNLEPQIQVWAELFAGKANALFLGRGLHYPIALEGALKLKEISYIHAEAYPAGELKHGPLALVDSNMPVVVIAPNDSLLEKVKSNMQEVRARGGELFVFADADSHFHASDGVHVIRTPRHAGLLSPIIHAIPVQLLAYHTAVKRGADVDKPRNLAKSVTVE
jgi:glucosamine--fructose-6-phosphate aminotransferase (isomerizing)